MSPSTELLAPGVRRLRPDDHFMILMETDATPMHVGALVILQTPPERKADLVVDLKRQFAERLAATPLLSVLRPSPDGFDSDVWVDLSHIDLDRHVTKVPGEDEMDDAALHAFVARRAMHRLDLSRPPFHIDILDRLSGDRSAFFMRMHHSVADGIGFQTLLGLLSDETPPAPPRLTGGVAPDPETWRVLAERRFEAETERRAAHSEARKQALGALKALAADPARQRAATPVLKLSGPTSDQRAFSTISFDLERLKSARRALGGTLNDLFLALVSTALRDYLIEIDDPPPTPLVVNSARSYRRAEHGAFGNRIVALHPHLATDRADPKARYQAIRASMQNELARTHLDEALLDAPDQPFGARDRRAKFAERASTGAAVIPGNITVSNVLGPGGARRYAGLAQIANFPTPLLGSGRFLNVTSRRNGERLDMGIMADAAKIPDVGRVAALLARALETYEAL